MDLDRLNTLILESGVTKTHIAKALGLSLQGLYNKLKGENDFTRGEVVILCDVLHIEDVHEKEAIFFAKKVD